MDLLGNDISIDDIKSVPDDCEFALEAILAEYGETGGPEPPAPAPLEDEGPSHPIKMEDEEDLISAEISSAIERSFDYETGRLPQETPEQEPEPEPEPQPEPSLEPEPEDTQVYKISEIIAEAEAIASAFSAKESASRGTQRAEAAETAETLPEPSVTGTAEDAAPRAPAETREKPERRAPAGRRGKTLGGVLAAPLLSLLAAYTLRKQHQTGTVASAPEEDEEDIGPELDADSASKYYAGHVKSLRLRLRLAAFLSIILAWISFGLPVAGALKTSPAVSAVVCLILLLTVVVLGLDIFTSGLLSLIRNRPGLWTLVSFSCITAALDAVVTAAGGASEGYPFCAVAALSMTFAIGGSLQTCRGFRLSLRALALSRTPYAVTAEAGVAEDGVTLLKSRRGTAGYLRRCEEPDCAESTYGSLAPALIAAAVVLSVLAAALSGEWRYFFRILAAIAAPCAPFAAFLAFPLPYSIITRQIFQSGAAIAGWAGLRDIGRSRHLIVTDRDIFPAGTLSIESIRILEGAWPEKVIACAGSVICASGSGLAPVFTELMKKNNCSLQRVEDFCCHEGGGLTAMMNGEEILCGNAGFMHLMSIRLPQKLASKSSVFISINGVLTGIFTVKYVPVTSVQDALASLLHTRREPIFAIRDFNITPLMIRQKFRMPTDGFDFPTFARRYEISSAEPSPDSQISAIISREGLGPLVEISEKGRRLYIAARLATILSVLCSLIGVLLMFMLCLSGSFDSATAGNVMTYMFLWLVPIIILAFGLGR